MMTDLRELTDAELGAVSGGHHAHGGLALHGDSFKSLLADIRHSLESIAHSHITVQNLNFTLQIAIVMFGGSISQASNDTNVTLIY
jgi:hypothetical protein